LVEGIIAPRGEGYDPEGGCRGVQTAGTLPGHEAVKDRLLQMAEMTEL